MSAVNPTIIRGPAVAIFDSQTFYTAGDIRVQRQRDTEATPSDIYGNIGDTLVAEKFSVSFTPIGEVENAIKYYPYGPSNLVDTTSVGTSIYNGTLVIHTLAGQTITFERAGIIKMPVLNLSPRKTMFGDIAFQAIGKSATARTDAAYFKTLASDSFTDKGLDTTKILKGLYHATLSEARSPVLGNIGAREGFEVEPFVETDDVMDDNVGYADTIIKNVGCKVRFSPNNLTESQIDSILVSQGADALLPGQFIGRGPVTTKENLTITGDPATIIAYRVGVTSSEIAYGTSVDRVQQLEFTTMQLTSNGAIQPIFSIVFN